MRTKKEIAEHAAIEKLNAPSVQTIGSADMNNISEGAGSSLASVFQAENESLSNRPVLEEGIKIEPSQLNLESLIGST